MSKELNFAIEAAKIAADIILEGYKSPKIIEHKSEFDLLTETDPKCEKAVVDFLTSSTPNFGILSEEGTEISGNPRWIIDPLDGTTNFSHQFPNFCVSIALVSDDLPIVGVIADPIRNELFYSESGSGSFLSSLEDKSKDSRKLEVSQNIEIGDCLISTGFPYQRDTALFENILNSFLILSKTSQSVRRTGSAALDLAYVASGRLDAYLVAGAKPWDLAAGILLVREAGGKILSLDSDSNPLYASCSLASNGKCHDNLMDMIDI